MAANCLRSEYFLIELRRTYWLKQTKGRISCQIGNTFITAIFRWDLQGLDWQNLGRNQMDLDCRGQIYSTQVGSKWDGTYIGWTGRTQVGWDLQRLDWQDPGGMGLRGWTGRNQVGWDLHSLDLQELGGMGLTQVGLAGTRWDGTYIDWTVRNQLRSRRDMQEIWELWDLQDIHTAHKYFIV